MERWSPKLSYKILLWSRNIGKGHLVSSNHILAPTGTPNDITRTAMFLRRNSSVVRIKTIEYNNTIDISLFILLQTCLIQINLVFTFSHFNCRQVLSSRQSSKVSQQHTMHIFNALIVGENISEFVLNHISKAWIVSVSSIYHVSIHYNMVKQRLLFVQYSDWPLWRLWNDDHHKNKLTSNNPATQNFQTWLFWYI